MPEDSVYPLSLVVAMYSVVSETLCPDISFRPANGPDGAAPVGGSNAARGVSGTGVGVADASSAAAAKKKEVINVWLETNYRPIACTVAIGENQSRASYRREKKARITQGDVHRVNIKSEDDDRMKKGRS